MKVELQGVRYSHPDFSLGPIDMDVEPGKIYVIMGKNGSGKSTTLRLIHGDLRPSEGSVLIDGIEASKLSFIQLAKKIAFVWQEIYNPLSFTVRDVMNVSGYSRDESEEDILKSLSILGMERFIDRDFSMLSGGEKRLVTIAAALYQDSEIIIMDEPTNFLDIDNQILVYNLIRNMRNMGKTLILTLHDIDAVHNISDYVLILKDGMEVAKGPTAETLTVRNLRRAFNVPFYTYDTINGKSFVGAMK